MAAVASETRAPKAKVRTARAAVLTAPRTLEVRDVAVPEPAAGQVRIRLEGCGVCGSNVPVWEGRPWFEYPLEPGAPGHEGWGVVDAVGPDVRGVREGDRVAALSYRAYAEYDVADAAAVVKLPPELDGLPFPGEPLGCAMNVLRRSDIRAGQTVAIIGIGFLGALLTRLAASAGARVIAISRRPYALDLARRMGAEQTSLCDDRAQIVHFVNALTDGQGCDRVIEAAGTQEPLTLAGELVRVRGRLIIAGYHQDGAREVNMQSWNWRGIDVINAHERDPQMYVEGIRLAIDEVVSGRLDPSPLLTHAFPLENLGTALEYAATRPEGFLKAVVKLGEW